MQSSPRPSKSLEERGLALHVNPADPTGPLLNYRPTVECRNCGHDLAKPITRKRRSATRSKKKRAKKS